jgi:hypothetical protein
MFFQKLKSPAFENLVEKLRVEKSIQFSISEITSMEIHSVLGKYRRGTTIQKQECGKKIDNGNVCANVWVTEKQPRIKEKAFRDLQKLVSDIENKRGDIRADILRVDQRVITEAKNILNKHADSFKFGSHDAMIAATVFVANKYDQKAMILVTSDRGLIAALKATQISFYDPTRNILTTF